MTSPSRHPIEARDSWKSFSERDSPHPRDESGEAVTTLARMGLVENDDSNINNNGGGGHVKTVSSSSSSSAHTHAPASSGSVRRKLHHKHDHHNHADYDDDADAQVPTLKQIEQETAAEIQSEQDAKKEKKRNKATKKHKKLLKALRKDPGIGKLTEHGLLIDAGSTGSRMHLYEWEPRALYDAKDVDEAVSGRKLSYPGTDSRWTDRLRPGIATFADLPDDQIVDAIAKYLAPLMEFATATLQEKQDDFGKFPIFLRATAGMRTLATKDRARVLDAVRSLFANDTFCPFRFQPEFARVLSGEEEAIFGWAGTNFLMGHLVEDSEGAGTVVLPKLTYGALDMGGASTQISFYEPNEDIMSNLFKLQIGQGKHWNLYAHSFLYYGINEASNRFHARVLAGFDASQRLIDGVYNPCLPGGSSRAVQSKIHVINGQETWAYNQTVGEYYTATLKNDNDRGDADACMAKTKELLHLDKNTWCDFSHKGDCSLAGVYQPELPRQSEHFGEFLAFSNYYDVWEFLGLPERASMAELKNATEHICSMSKDEVFAWNEDHAKADDEDVEEFCFRSTYAYQLLTNGYGFEPDEYVTATNVINGQKVGWALGAMLYELNTFPWEYIENNMLSDSSESADSPLSDTGFHNWNSVFLAAMIVCIAAALIVVFRVRNQRNRHHYESVK